MYMKITKNGIKYILCLIGIEVFFFLIRLIPMNLEYFQYNSNAEDSQVFEGRIVSIREDYYYKASRREHYATVEWTEDGEVKTFEFLKPMLKKTGDFVKLARLSDGRLVPLFLRFPGNEYYYLYSIITLLVILVVIILLKASGLNVAAPKLNEEEAAPAFRVSHRRGLLSGWQESMGENLYGAARRDDKLQNMINMNAAATINMHTSTTVNGLNVNQEVEISEEPEAVIPLKHKEPEAFTSYAPEQTDTYEGINLDDLVVEKLDE